MSSIPSKIVFEKVRKRREKHPTENLVFSQYTSPQPNGGCYEVWVTPEKMEKMSRLANERMKEKIRNRPPKIIGGSRRMPGDVHPETGMLFLCYHKGYERWASKETFLKNRDYHKKYFQKIKSDPEKYKVLLKENQDKRKTTKFIEWRRQWERNHRASNNLVRLSNSLRSTIGAAIRKRGYTKRSSLMKIVGCSLEEVRAHLEKRFTDGMTWDNHGYSGWHVDHIIPLSSAKNEEELLKLCHYTNLQPLWAKDNWIKGTKIPYEA